jgi:plasmid stabilization system protein ParE
MSTARNSIETIQHYIKLSMPDCTSECHRELADACDRLASEIESLNERLRLSESTAQHANNIAHRIKPLLAS